MPTNEIRLGFVRRAILAFLLIVACALTVLLPFDRSFTLSARFLILGAILVLISLLAMTVKVSADPDLRRKHFGSPASGFLPVFFRFRKSYRKRFGIDAWLVILPAGIVLFFLGMIFDSVAW